MENSKKVRRDLLLERIAKLETYAFSEDCGEILKNIYESHIEYLRNQLKECEDNENVVQKVSWIATRND